jgi:hypothetical protein
LQSARATTICFKRGRAVNGGRLHSKPQSPGAIQLICEIPERIERELEVSGEPAGRTAAGKPRA